MFKQCKHTVFNSFSSVCTDFIFISSFSRWKASIVEEEWKAKVIWVCNDVVKLFFLMNEDEDRKSGVINWSKNWIKYHH